MGLLAVADWRVTLEMGIRSRSVVLHRHTEQLQLTASFLDLEESPGAIPRDCEDEAVVWTEGNSGHSERVSFESYELLPIGGTVHANGGVFSSGCFACRGDQIPFVRRCDRDELPWQGTISEKM